MIVIINDSPKEKGKRIRGIIGRYCWKVSRDVWVWSKASMRTEIKNELLKYDDKMRVIFIWKESRSELGFNFEMVGNLNSRSTKFGLFNHLAEFGDNE